jgi:hypothetical protein
MTRALLGGMRGYADPILLIALWVVIAFAGTWGYIETKRAKTEQSGKLEPGPSDSDLTPAEGIDAHQEVAPDRPDADPARVEPAADRQGEPLQPLDVVD